MSLYEDYDYDYHGMASDAYFIDYQEDAIDESWDMDYTDDNDSMNNAEEYENYYHNILEDIDD